MMPRLAALSIAEIRPRISFGSDLALAPVARFCIPRSRERTLRLRNARRAACRARFDADLVFAIFILPNESELRQALSSQ